VIEQRVRPDKKVYEITTAGLDALKEWVTAPVELRMVRDELVLKAYSVWLADPQRAAAFFHEQQQLHKERLLDYEEIGSWIEKEWKEDLHRPESPHFASYARSSGASSTNAGMPSGAVGSPTGWQRGAGEGLEVGQDHAGGYKMTVVQPTREAKWRPPARSGTRRCSSSSTLRTC
jgi:hypothetical protein